MGYVPALHSFGPDKFQFGANFHRQYSIGSSESGHLSDYWLVSHDAFRCVMEENAFKNAYDHIWYVLGLIAALYFVVDNGLPSYKEDLSQSGVRTTSIMQLYRSGEHNLTALCKDPVIVNRAPDLCSLAPAMRWSYQDSLLSKDILRARIDLPDWVSSVASDSSLKKQIDVFNSITCSSSQFRASCQTVPIEMSLDEEDFRRPVAFLPPPYAQALQQLHKSMEKADQRIQEIERGHNARYFVFLLLAFVAEGKLTNASRSMVKHDNIRPPSWIFMIIRFFAVKALLMCRMLVKGITMLLIGIISLLVAQRKIRVDRRQKEDYTPSGQD